MSKSALLYVQSVYPNLSDINIPKQLKLKY